MLYDKVLKRIKTKVKKFLKSFIDEEIERKLSFSNYCFCETIESNYLNRNKVVIVKKNGEKIINPSFIEGLCIRMSGQDNMVTIYEPFLFQKAMIFLTGNTDILIRENIKTSSGFLIEKTRNSVSNKLIIGRNFECGPNCTIDLTDSGDVFIGDDAKWSWNVYVKSDDTHPVFDVKTKKVINKSTCVIIGNHVWVGMHATILKNSEIKDNSVIGAYSVVAKQFSKNNVVIAGNPADVKKEDINWSHGSIQSYIDKNEKD